MFPEFLSYSGVRQTDELRINSVSILLSGSTDTFINMVLQDRYLHRTVRIYKAWINIDTNSILGSPSLIYAGTITGASVVDNAKEKGGLAMLTWHHFKVKLPYYEKASKGKLDMDKAKDDYVEFLNEVAEELDLIVPLELNQKFKENLDRYRNTFSPKYDAFYQVRKHYEEFVRTIEINPTLTT